MTVDPTEPHLGLVVEGPGDAGAVPLLLRRWLQSRGIYQEILGKPIRCNGRDKATMPLGIEGFTSVAAARPGCRGILVVLDGEGDSVCELGPQLLARCVKTVGHIPIVVCLAEDCFEDWIYASCETLEIGKLNYRRRTSGLAAIVASLKPAKYVKPTWQPRLTARIDIEKARRRSASLDRCLVKLDQMVEEQFG